MRTLTAALALFALPLAACGDGAEVAAEEATAEETALEVEAADEADTMAEVLDEATDQTPTELEAAMTEPAATAGAPIDELPAPDPGTDVYFVERAESGDRACYLTLEPVAEGASVEELADFAICDMIAEVPAPVHIRVLEREQGEVMAMSCEGNPDCPDRDTVDLIMRAEIVSL